MSIRKKNCVATKQFLPRQTPHWAGGLAACPGKKLWALKLDGSEAPALESEDPGETLKDSVDEITFWACSGPFSSLVNCN